MDNIKFTNTIILEVNRGKQRWILWKDYNKQRYKWGWGVVVWSEGRSTNSYTVTDSLHTSYVWLFIVQQLTSDCHRLYGTLTADLLCANT